MTAPTAVDRRALADMPLFDSATLKCPYHYDKTLRDEAPVYRDPASGVKLRTLCQSSLSYFQAQKNPQ